MKRLILAILLISSIALVACGAPEPESILLEPATVATPTLDPEQPVEYGATLEEYSEAVNGEQAAVSEPTAIPEPVAEVAAPTESAETATAETDEQLMSVDPTMFTEDGYAEILWDALVPADYSADAIMDKYATQLANLSDGSAEASELYTRMQEEFNSAPVNEMIDGERVKLPGFIAPLEYEGELITKFLLVPYFGACVHSPAPPVNQTVLVDTAAGEGISPSDSYAPIWIKGVMTTESATTDLAESGYYMQDALIEPYK